MSRSVAAGDAEKHEQMRHAARLAEQVLSEPALARVSTQRLGDEMMRLGEMPRLVVALALAARTRPPLKSLNDYARLLLVTKLLEQGEDLPSEFQPLAIQVGLQLLPERVLDFAGLTARWAARSQAAFQQLGEALCHGLGPNQASLCLHTLQRAAVPLERKLGFVAVSNVLCGVLHESAAVYPEAYASAATVIEAHTMDHVVLMCLQYLAPSQRQPFKERVQLMVNPVDQEVGLAIVDANNFLRRPDLRGGLAHAPFSLELDSRLLRSTLQRALRSGGFTELSNAVEDHWQVPISNLLCHHEDPGRLLEALIARNSEEVLKHPQALLSTFVASPLVMRESMARLAASSAPPSFVADLLAAAVSALQQGRNSRDAKALTEFVLELSRRIGYRRDPKAQEQAFRVLASLEPAALRLDCYGQIVGWATSSLQLAIWRDGISIASNAPECLQKMGAILGQMTRATRDTAASDLSSFPPDSQALVLAQALRVPMEPMELVSSAVYAACRSRSRPVHLEAILRNTSSRAVAIKLLIEEEGPLAAAVEIIAIFGRSMPEVCRETIKLLHLDEQAPVSMILSAIDESAYELELRASLARVQTRGQQRAALEAAASRLAGRLSDVAWPLVSAMLPRLLPLGSVDSLRDWVPKLENWVRSIEALHAESTPPPEVRLRVTEAPLATPETEPSITAKDRKLEPEKLVVAPQRPTAAYASLVAQLHPADGAWPIGTSRQFTIELTDYGTADACDARIVPPPFAELSYFVTCSSDDLRVKLRPAREGATLGRAQFDVRRLVARDRHTLAVAVLRDDVVVFTTDVAVYFDRSIEASEQEES